jgi:hypothetical protein
MYIYKGITILTQVGVWCSGKIILTLEVMGLSPQWKQFFRKNKKETCDSIQFGSIEKYPPQSRTS